MQTTDASAFNLFNTKQISSIEEMYVYMKMANFNLPVNTSYMRTAKRITIIIFTLGITFYASAQSNKTFLDGFAIYGGFGPNMWFSNAQPGDNISTSYEFGLDKELIPGIELGGNLEFGSLYGERRFNGYLDFSSKTSYFRASLLGTLDMVDLIWGRNDPIFHIRFFAGVSYLNGSIDIENSDAPEVTNVKYYDLTRSTGSYGNIVFPGGASMELDITNSFTLYGSMTGVLELTDELDGVGYLGVYEYGDLGDQYRYYDFDRADWIYVTKDNLPTDDQLALNWFDNYIVLKVGVKYNFGKSAPRNRSKHRKGGSKDNYGNYKRLPDRIMNFNGEDGLDKPRRPKY